MTDNPFTQAILLERRLKLLLWGKAGTGKTILSLQFPAPVVIDLEDGTNFYADKYKFSVIKTSDVPDASQVYHAINWLAESNHPYKTLVIDPITVYWELLQRKWSGIFLKRNSGKANKHEFYDLQPKEWMTIKSEFKALVRLMVKLDMNVILTAHGKVLYKEGAYPLVAIGDTFDAEKGLSYMLDTICKIYFNTRGERSMVCEKDRTGHLVTGVEYPASYEPFAGAFGKSSLEKGAVPVQTTEGG